MKLSIVTTLYRSEATIDEFYRRAVAAAEPITQNIEIVMVNDGSPDNSLSRAVALHKADPRVVVVDLSRNFGHHKALMTGLTHATGDLIFLIDSDLEEEPELLAPFYARHMEGDCDVVFGVQTARRGGWFERTTGTLFFSLVNILSDHSIPRNVVVARLMTRDYVRALIRHRDREFLIAHLWQMTGFRQVQLPVKKLSESPTTYSVRMRVAMAVKFLTTTSTKLLYGVLYLGLCIFVLSTLAIGYYVCRYLLSGIGVDGYTSIIVSIWFFGGLTTLILGILGIYIANVVAEVKRRPYTVVRSVHRARDAAVSLSNVVHVPSREARHDSGPRT
ncbi:glycosyltransferase family 2 protein [Bradyrhizobium sp. CCGUVB14]|uniref:glycosyltransferase family 2 protein n=1 Tax=Bradyrhizobium sp. CCGUVB14 TaxID=2949628 RepID=UPI0020B1C6E7|nr:glycosyltransferase family 2 protein [Bradyrhizobium sp. CCGUVB14]MCP3445723.1 glycosyltransferase family 2 protein [Bradyrhizobium sp. CCGUVB14]